MKQTNITIKIAGSLIFLALLAWLGIYGYQALDNPYRTVRAVGYTVRDSAPVSGIVVRDESVLFSVYSSVYLTAEEGKRVSGGQTLAEAFDSEDALRRAVRAGELRQLIGQLTSQLDAAAAASDMLRLETDIQGDVQALRASLNSRELAGVEELALSLKTRVFTASSDEADIRGRLEAYQAELRELQRLSDAQSALITAPESGLFSTAVDGWEDLGTAALKKITVSALAALLEQERAVPDYALGKLVYGTKWTYAVLMDQAAADRLQLGKQVSILFGRYYNERLEMKVSWISALEDGQRAVLLTCDTDMTDVLSMRRQEAELVFTEEEGLRIPRSALHADEEGRACVYVQTGLQAEKKLVELCHDYGDFYMVTSDTLRLGDQVIVSARNLYDGKVVG